MRTLRDEFAAAALTGMIGHAGRASVADCEAAYVIASAMVAARGVAESGDSFDAAAAREPRWSRIAFFGHHSYVGRVSAVEHYGARMLLIEEFCPQGHLLRAVRHAPSSLFSDEDVTEEEAKRHTDSRVCHDPDHIYRCNRCGRAREHRAPICENCGERKFAAPAATRAPEQCYDERRRERIAKLSPEQREQPEMVEQLAESECGNHCHDSHHRGDPCEWPVCAVHRPETAADNGVPY